MNDAPVDQSKQPGLVSSSTADRERLRTLGSRVCAHWLLKLVGISGFIAIFFAAYFWTLRSPLFPVTTVPTTLLDRLVPFYAGALPLYLSLWVYVSLPPSLLEDRWALFAYGIAAGGLAVVGLGIFTFWPTAIVPPVINWSEYPAFSLLRSIDAAGNACPSLHVAFSVFSAIWLDRLLRRTSRRATIRILNVCWCIGIMYSTLATKQHVALDLFGGTVLGAVGAAWNPQGKVLARVA